MKITISLPPDKAALLFKLFEEGALDDLPIESVQRVEETGVRYKYVLADQNQIWGQGPNVERKKRERQLLEQKVRTGNGKAMSEVPNAQLAYRKATSPHRMTTKPTFRKGYRLVNHLVKIEKANRK